MIEICKLIGIWPFNQITAVMIGRQTIYYQPGTVLRSVAIMDFHQTRCEDKPSPACEHAVPSSRAELLIRTIAETNTVDLWQARSTMTNSMG